MLTIQFIEQNLHFAISLLAALVFFAVFWLYFDAWIGEGAKSKRDAMKWAGFLLLALSFVPYATLVEESNLGTSLFGSTGALVANALRLIGYIVIIVSQLIDPLQEKPKTTGIDQELLGTEEPSAPNTAGTPLVAGLSSTNGFGLAFGLPLAALAIAGLYWRRATTGLEQHLKPVAVAFVLLFGFELFSLANIFRSTANPTLFDLVKAFGPAWVISHVCLLLGVLALGRWVWRYLTERFMSQLFMTFTSTVLAIFVLTTISFTFLLLNNIQSNALNNLATATNVLSYALDSKKAATQANAEAVAANPAIAQAISAKDHNALVSLTSTFLASKQQTSLIVTNVDGQVLLRAEDPLRWGDSVSSDTLVRRALIGTVSSTVESQSAILAPVVSIRSVAPVEDSGGNIIGTVSVSAAINSIFLDGIKHSTGLDAAIYSGDIRSATTFTAPDGTTRWIGVKETDPAVQSTVLRQGKTFKGTLSVLNRDYLVVYAPLKDADNAIIGMLFIGQPEITVLQTTSYLIGLTFIVASVLLVLSIIPAYLIARHIAGQLG